MIDQSTTACATNLGAMPMMPLMLSLPDVQRITGLSRSTIYDLMKRGDFPQQRKVKQSRSVVWSAKAVLSWVAEVLDDDEVSVA